VTQQDWHLAYFPLLAADEITNVADGFIVPVYDQDNNVMGYMSTQDLILNPTEGFIPYRGSTKFKDSPAEFDTITGRIIVSVPVVFPQVIVELSDDENVTTATDIVFCTGTLTANLVDPSTAIKQVTIRSISGTTTITADSGTVERSSLSTAQSVTLAPRASGWFII